MTHSGLMVNDFIPLQQGLERIYPVERSIVDLILIHGKEGELGKNGKNCINQPL